LSKVALPHVIQKSTRGNGSAPGVMALMSKEPEKGKPSERAGRKAAGLSPSGYGSRVAGRSSTPFVLDFARNPIGGGIVILRETGNRIFMPVVRKTATVAFSLFFIFTLMSLLPFANTRSEALQVTLAWDASSDPDVSGYKLYYGTQSKNYSAVIPVGTQTSCIVSGLVVGTHYYFAVTAFDVSGLESAFSNEATWSAPVDATCYADFDGDGKMDTTVWRPLDGNWYVISSSTGTATVRQWGTNGDVPVPGDFDGDNKTDIAVWRPSNGTWYVINSSTGTTTARQWGGSADTPVPGDYDGDGKIDIAVWRPSNGTWYVINSSTGTTTARQWGGSADIPISGDFDGDGKTDLVVWRPSNGTWYVINSSTGTTTVRQWGGSADIPVPGDYDGDGKTDMAVWRPSIGNWYVINSSTGTTTVRQWGGSADIPVPGDYDGDGKTDVAVWRPSDGNWYIINSSIGTTVVRQWGIGSTSDWPMGSRAIDR
jgi:hypothetical protein